MIAAVEILLLVALVSLSVTHFFTVRAMGKLQRERDDALYRQTKGIRQNAERTRLEAVAAQADAVLLHENTKLLHKRVDDIINDPGVRRVMRGGRG